MIDFGALPVAEARQYAASYAQGAPLRAEWLAQEVRASNGQPGSADGPGGLGQLWSWLAGRIINVGPADVVAAVRPPAADPQAGLRPPWHGDQSNPYVSDDLLWMVDAIGCHLASLVQQVNPTAIWQVHRSAVRNDVNQNRTVLAGLTNKRGFADPAGLVYGTIIGHATKGRPLAEDALTALFDHMTGSVTAQPRSDGQASGAEASQRQQPDQVDVPVLAGPTPDLPDHWHGYRAQLAAAGRTSVAQQLTQSDGFGIVAGGQPAGQPPQPGERWVALFDEVRGLIGDPAIEGLADRLRRLDGVAAAQHRRREYVEVIGTITTAQLAAYVVADLALYATPPVPG